VPITISAELCLSAPSSSHLVSSTFRGRQHGTGTTDAQGRCFKVAKYCCSKKTVTLGVYAVIGPPNLSVSLLNKTFVGALRKLSSRRLRCRLVTRILATRLGALSTGGCR
jgi:hypothetical protein